MEDPTLPLPGLSPVSGKPIKARFDGGMLSSDAGILVLREVEKRLGVAERLALTCPPSGPSIIVRAHGVDS
jgi:hypothetical protein